MNDLEKRETLTPVEIREQVNLIQEVMKGVMIKDTHYGVVPGCGDKPTLLKAGAEKLAMTFRLDLETAFEIIELQGGHREYRATTTAYSLNSGKRMGNGSGSACTLEGKWRYRAENTGAKVPKEYWESRDPSLIGGSQFSARKVGGEWFIYHKVEHDNPADFYNTCMKMAEKRSKVACVLNVTCASDIFTQDIEDMPEVIPQNKTAAATVKKTEKKKTEEDAPKSELMVRDLVSEIHEHSGTSKTGKPYTKYGIELMNGETYGTFSGTYADMARAALEAGVEVDITYETNKFGHTVTAMESPLEEIAA